jgi:hypothetical protein
MLRKKLKAAYIQKNRARITELACKSADRRSRCVRIPHFSSTFTMKEN